MTRREQLMIGKIVDELSKRELNEHLGRWTEMKKAKFVRKYYGRGYDRDFVYLVYEYRGHEYTVYENRAKGNEPLAWQHRSEQARIDRLIDEENKPKKPYRYEDSAAYGFDLFMRYVNGDETVFDK